MDSLEGWMGSLVSKPIELLNGTYVDEEDAKRELDSLQLPKVDGHTVAASHVSGVAIQRLHDKIRGHLCEDAIWRSVLWYLAHPLPGSIAHDLIDRGVATSMMGVTRQVDEVQWRLATFDVDALYTLIRERYVEPQFSVAQFEAMLKRYSHTSHSEGILYMLSFYETPSPEKKAAFVAAIVCEKRNWRKWKHIKKRLKRFMREQPQ